MSSPRNLREGLMQPCKGLWWFFPWIPLARCRPQPRVLASGCYLSP